MSDCFKVPKFFELVLVGLLLVGLAGCKSSKSLTSSSPELEQPENLDEGVETVEASGDPNVQEVPSELALEAAEKYDLAKKLLEFAGPIEDLSDESANVRRLGVDLLKTAIELDPTEFKYYQDLFMTHMVLQEPVKALEVLEPASKTPGLAEEVAEFQSLVFGAVEYVSSLDEEI